MAPIMYPPIMHAPVGGLRPPGGFPIHGFGAGGPVSSDPTMRPDPTMNPSANRLHGLPERYPGIGGGLPGRHEGNLQAALQEFLSRFGGGLPGHGINSPGIQPAAPMQEGAGSLGGHPLAGLIEALGAAAPRRTFQAQ